MNIMYAQSPIYLKLPTKEKEEIVTLEPSSQSFKNLDILVFKHLNNTEHYSIS